MGKLAERSAVSAKEIRKLIAASGTTVGEGVRIAQDTLKTMDTIIAGSKATSEMIDELSSAIRQGVSGIHEVNESVRQISEMSLSISAATEEQSTNSRQIGTTLESINQLTQQTASASEEMAASTLGLTELAQRLQGQVSRFTLGVGQEEALAQGSAVALPSAPGG